MQVVLALVRPDAEERSYSIVKSTTVLGRSRECDMRIRHTKVSRKHCRLQREESGLFIEDLGSSNGTFVNGEPVERTRLASGDKIGVGPVEFVVTITEPPAL
jgi:pSer/pThr/pTyr-binding forkhead associated (FHA) protein